MQKRKSNPAVDTVGVRGFYHVQITEGGKIVGDSGWRENQVTNAGIQSYIVENVLNGAGQNVTHMAIGTGGAPLATDTTLSGQLTGGKRASVSTSVVNSKTARFVAVFASSNAFVTASANIANLGLVNSSATNAGLFLCGASFASSTVTTNQNINVTYELRFA